MLRGVERAGTDLDQYVEERVLTTTLEKALNWARSNALFPATFGLACCAIEMMSIVTARYDSARFGAEVFRASPRQADMLILSGRVSIKMAPVVRRIYDQMLEPKWVIAMGACSPAPASSTTTPSCRAPTSSSRSTSTCPDARRGPEALLHGMIKLQAKIKGDPDPAGGSATARTARRSAATDPSRTEPDPDTCPTPPDSS